MSAGRHGVFVITCYALRGRTASGAPVSESGVAVDPRLIQLGSWITVEGLGRLQARDTGGAIKGMRLDIWKPSEAACRAWGVQRRAVTY